MSFSATSAGPGESRDDRQDRTDKSGLAARRPKSFNLNPAIGGAKSHMQQNSIDAPFNRRAGLSSAAGVLICGQGGGSIPIPATNFLGNAKSGD
jgi:hypothetical protein